MSVILREPDENGRLTVKSGGTVVGTVEKVSDSEDWLSRDTDGNEVYRSSNRGACATSLVNPGKFSV